MFKDEIRKARAKLEMSLVRNVKNTKGFYRYMRQKRKITIKCAQTQTNTINNTGEIVTTNMEKAEILTFFFARVFTGNHSSHLSQVSGHQGWAKKIPPIIGEDQAQDNLMNLNIHKFMGHDKMHPRVLTELAD